MLGEYILKLSALDIEFLLREVLTMATYPFEFGKL